jgi:hypothetical protein
MRKNRASRKSIYLYTGARRGLHGGLPKEGEDHQGSGDSGQPQNNGTGNSGDSGQNGQNQNNDGLGFEPASFWNNPEPADGGTGESQGPTDEEFGQTLMQSITNFTPPTIFDAETASQIAEGNLEGVNQRMQQFGQTMMRQAMIMTAQILQRFEGQVDGRIKGSITENSTRQSDESMLAEQFPSFAKKEVRPVIQGVFQQSLKHSKGDRTKALEMTRGMLKSMGQLGAGDFGLSTPPSNPDDFTSNGPSSLVQELLQMR